MPNLLAQTIECMQHRGRTPEEIIFIGSRASGHSCTWAEYRVLADIEYDDGYGGAEVAGDLEIIFDDGAFMDRGEYDGSEWWNYYAPFIPPTETHPIARLVRTDMGYESTLAEIAKSMAAVEES